MRGTVTFVCLALSLPLGWLCWKFVRGAESTTALREVGTDAVDRIAELARGEPAWIRRFPDSQLQRFPLSEESAAWLFPLDNKFNRYDAHSYFAHRPNLKERMPLAEHPAGQWMLRTNSIGVRRDSELSDVRPDLRVLVVGDSHTEGVCNNSESFAALAEAELRARDPERSIEVVNTARGGFGPLNYVGVVEKFEYLAPQVVVVVVTESNDFTDSLALAHGFARTRPEPYRPEAIQALRRARTIDPDACGSGLSGAHYFREHPLEIDYALDLAHETCAEIQRICDAIDARAVFAFLPAPCFLDWTEEPDGMQRVRSELGLTAEDVERYRAMGDRFVQQLASAGFDVLDLRPLLAGPAEELYWNENYHLDLGGHELVGHALALHLSEGATLSASTSPPDQR